MTTPNINLFDEIFVKALADEAETLLQNSHNEEWQDAYNRIAHGAMILAANLRRSRINGENIKEP